MVSKRKIKLKFTDFWVNYNKAENNIFYEMLSKIYDLELSEEPEILFYSCYGNEHIKYKCKKIFYSAENQRPNFKYCDFAITFDFLVDPRHFRFPLFGLYCNPDELIWNENKAISLNDWKLKSKFCCIVVSNPNAVERIEFYHELSKYKKVDSAGKWNNNIEIGPSHLDKLNFIKDYKFVISYENSSYPGYTTEKIIEPLMTNSIPIYWGNPLVEYDINSKRIINVHKYNSIKEVIQSIIEIDNNEVMAVDMVNNPIFTDNKVPDQIKKSEMLNFLVKAIENKKIPIAQSIVGRMNIFVFNTWLWYIRLRGRIGKSFHSGSKYKLE